MKYLSLFSGIEAASAAWKPLGWECVAVSEILEYQSNVIKKHYPEVKNFGDVTKIVEDDIKSLGKIDVVIFGSPCQDMSVAGKQCGLETVKEDTNHSSILFFEGMRVFRLAHKHCGARFLVWENVPGALNSQKGEDFGKILREMVGVEFSSGGRVWGNEGICCGRDSMLEWAVLDAQWFGVAQRRRRLFIVLDTGNWKDRQPILLESDSLRGDSAPSRKKRATTSTEVEGSVRETSTFNFQAIGEYGVEPVASTLKARDYKDATDLIVAKCFQQNMRDELRYINEDGLITGALVAQAGANGNNYIHVESAYASATSKVRKLTPLECERLQGFPDNWTQLGDTPFSKRINALGRSMAVPVIQWIGKQIEAVYEDKQ